MFAPAQKNFSPCPVMTMTCTSLSKRGLQDGAVEVLHHLVRVAVDRRIVQREQRGAAGRRGVIDESHGALYQAVEKALPLVKARMACPAGRAHERAGRAAEVKELMVEELNLEGKTPADIDDAAPLFGAGLGLDSLDALQLAMSVEERFGVRIPEGDEARQIFASVDALVEPTSSSATAAAWGALPCREHVRRVRIWVTGIGVVLAAGARGEARRWTGSSQESAPSRRSRLFEIPGRAGASPRRSDGLSPRRSRRPARPRGGLEPTRWPCSRRARRSAQAGVDPRAVPRRPGRRRHDRRDVRDGGPARLAVARSRARSRR